jgi:hypothetical protein
MEEKTKSTSANNTLLSAIIQDELLTIDERANNESQ